jgi:uncharacterized protein (DUF924 family)
MRDSRQEIIYFWFEETDPALWYQNNPDFDSLIRDRFTGTYSMAREGLCDVWRQDTEGSLALCLVLSQFPRRMFRDKAQAYGTDDKALLVAKNAVAKGFDQILPPVRRRFIYLPYQHSERLGDQKAGLALLKAIRADDPPAYENARRSLDIIEKFGRFPQRNAILGRINTPEEEEYLARHAAAA